MEQNNLHNTIQTVLEKIQNNTLTSKPKYYFVLRLIAVIILILVVLVISTFILSFILFSLHTRGEFSLFQFGTAGVGIFLAQFPWWMLLVDIVLVFILENLLRTFRFAYTYPILYIGLAAAVLVIIASVIVEQTPFHRDLLQQADHQHLPAFNNFYEQIRHAPPEMRQDFHRCIITNTNPLTVTIEHQNGTVMPHILVITNDTEPFIVGEELFISGPIINTTIEAEHIAVLPPPPPEGQQ